MALRLGQLWRYCRIAFALLLQCPSATAPRQAGTISTKTRNGTRQRSARERARATFLSSRWSESSSRWRDFARRCPRQRLSSLDYARLFDFRSCGISPTSNHLANVVANYRRGKSAVRSRVLFASLAQNLFDNRDEIGFAPCRRSLSGLHKIQREECN